ncbi:MAG: HAMP domain-containing protein [Oscillospiraceae bacterium]|nr:HAMP domain-containing protein [Oscillospiraceae bacterium]
MKLSQMSIKKHIIVATIIMVLIPLIIVGFTAAVLNYYATVNVAKNNMEELAIITSERVEWEIRAFQNFTNETGCSSELADPNVSNERKLEILNLKSSQYQMERGNLIGADGISILDGKDYTDRNYYQEAMKGNSTISEPLVSKVTGKITLIIAAPLWKDGISGGTPIGCVYFVPHEEFLNDIMREIHFSENSAAYIIDSQGNTIADVDSDIVKNGENIEAIAASEGAGQRGYATLAAAHVKMRNGETGFCDYTLNGVRKFIGYAPVANTNGWSLAVYAPTNDFLRNSNISFMVTVALIIIAIGISNISATRLGIKIGNPIKRCAERIQKLSQGDLTSPVPQPTAQDETGVLAEATASLVNDFNSIIGDVDYLLSSMADGYFDVQSEDPDRIYVGDFHKLIDSVDKINGKLTDTLRQINDSAEQVSCGAEQVSGGAQSLSQGATEQASSIEELSATISMISDMVNTNARDAADAAEKTDVAGAALGEANGKMNELVEAMNEISASSAETQKIIKTIEDIAFQTNILALNAAVEAARAGAAGKGFAVVADEVRNLAGKSAEAAKNTTALIEGTVTAIEKGNSLVTDTAEMMNTVAESAGAVAQINGKIAESSKNAADAIVQVTTGVEQISAVVQTNSATAEESAAASEELAGQSGLMRELVGSFRLRAE